MRFQLKLAVLAAVAIGIAYLSTAAAKDEEKIKDVKGCMAFQNKLRRDLPELLKSKDPQWEDIRKETKEWVTVAESLGKQTPPKGTAESWKTQSTKYLENVKAVDAAAEKKDVAAAKQAMATVENSCRGCHGPHRPPMKK